jgi:hypothetical protein
MTTFNFMLLTPEAHPSFRKRWFKSWPMLLLPWPVFIGLALVRTTEWGDQLEGTLPLGVVDWDRGMIGSAGLFVGCFTCWAYFRYRDKGFQGHTLLALTVIWTAILSGTAALICSVIFLFLSVQC